MLLEKRISCQLYERVRSRTAPVLSNGGPAYPADSKPWLGRSSGDGPRLVRSPPPFIDRFLAPNSFLRLISSFRRARLSSCGRCAPNYLLASCGRWLVTRWFSSYSFRSRRAVGSCRCLTAARRRNRHDLRTRPSRRADEASENRPASYSRAQLRWLPTTPKFSVTSGAGCCWPEKPKKRSSICAT